MDYKKMVEEKEAQFAPLRSRNDTDKDLYNLKAFQLKDWLDQDIKHVINVTCNDPRVMADRIVGWLQGAVMQTVVEGKQLQMLPDKKTSLIENFLDKGLYPAVDKRLQQVPNRNIPSLYHFQCFHSALRGRVVARVLIGMVGDNFVPDILPIDSRYFCYESGSDGMKWGSSRTTRSKELINAEYPNVGLTSATGEVLDIWTEDKNIVYVEDKEAKQVKQKLGYPPFVVAVAPTGSMLQDTDAFGNSGESIYAANRSLYDEKSRLLSILQTLDMMGFRAALQYASQQGISAELPQEDPRAVGGVVPVEIGGGYSLIPVQDIRNSAHMFLAMIEAMLQRGGLPTIDYGSLNFPLSGSAIELLQASKDPLFLPRLQCLAVFYQSVSRMAIQQYIDKKIRVELGEEKVYYTPQMLEGDFLINYKFFPVSPEEELANYSKATAAREWYDPDTIRRDVLKMQNPDEVKRKVDAHLAEMADPALAQYNRTKSLIEQGEDILARMSMARLEEMLMQRQMAMQGGISAQGIPEESVELPKGSPIPLFGKGGGGGVRRPPVQETEE